MKNKIYSWKENPASSNTWIWANYSELKETTDNSWKLVKVCKRRCCVNFLGNTKYNDTSSLLETSIFKRYRKSRKRVI